MCLLENHSEISTYCFAVHQDKMKRDREKGQKVNRKKAFQAEAVNVPEAISKVFSSIFGKFWDHFSFSNTLHWEAVKSFFCFTVEFSTISCALSKVPNCDNSSQCYKALVVCYSSGEVVCLGLSSLLSSAFAIADDKGLSGLHSGSLVVI